jgi:hypothetical protein
MTGETDFAMCLASSAKVDTRAEYYGCRADLQLLYFQKSRVGYHAFIISFSAK